MINTISATTIYSLQALSFITNSLSSLGGAVALNIKENNQSTVV